ncbi:DM13 domain-containing protein [Litoreibacter janthinus]|uniref:Electron transfer DM13 n=1 Tax=Litoreibacter janthinus TaxID=670154 RepID=A0A1I6FZY7_9RHOB|nr:DM13 domain-containing protein [Litoreibacter janthinus]SFR35407.1 Electron transfer DM13 [Litoreibacter janthinus]
MISRRAILRGAVTVSTVAALPAFAGGHGRIGKFKGASNHKTSGRAELVKSGQGGSVELLGDFKFDGAPDPKVALGNNGYDPKTLMGPLKSNAGASTYKLPKGVNPDDYNEVWIWCEKFNVPLGVAKL